MTLKSESKEAYSAVVNINIEAMSLVNVYKK